MNISRGLKKQKMLPLEQTPTLTKFPLAWHLLAVLKYYQKVFFYQY